MIAHQLPAMSSNRLLVAGIGTTIAAKGGPQEVIMDRGPKEAAAVRRACGGAREVA